jgi:hypothetical protein
MPDVRTLTASALRSSNLADAHFHETSSDRVKALAHADRLGSLLWRLKDAQDGSAYQPAVNLLAERLCQSRRPEPFSMRQRVAEVALREWLDDRCSTCSGRGRVKNLSSPIATKSCGTCAGTGVRRYSDVERGIALGLPTDNARKWAGRLARASEVIAAAENKTRFVVNAQLERIVGSRVIAPSPARVLEESTV